MTINPTEPTPSLNPAQPPPRLNMAAPPFGGGRPLEAVVASAQPGPGAGARVTARRVVPVVRPSREVERHATDRRHVEALDRARAFEALTASAHERGFWYPCWSFPALTAAVVPGVSTGRRLNLDGRGSTACRIAGDGTPPQCGTDADVRRWELADVDRLDEEIEW